MLSDSTNPITILLDRSQWTITNIVQLIAALVGIVVALYSFPNLVTFIIVWLIIWFFAYPFWKRQRIQDILEKELPKEFFSKESIQLATRYYIPPYCSNTDPTQGDDSVTQRKLNSEVQPKLFDTIDKFINEIPKEPYLWLLSDSGTGKSSFVLNYYARNRRRFWWRRQRLAVVWLGLPDIENYITPIQNKAKTVLFLDGFDEYTRASENYEARFHVLLEWSREFKRVLISCRTQFFPNDVAIPHRTNILRPVIRPAGTPATYEFSKLYIAPFTDEQVRAYLKKRFPFPQREKREEAFAIVKSHSALLQRPMLLAYVPDLLESGKTFQYTFQLYEEMVDAWLEREHPYVKGADKDSLRDFSERLAIDLYTNREERGAERVERKQLTKLAKEWDNFNLNEWQLSSRSLLNRDAAGYYKFAHRSIMEYLFVKRFIAGDKAYTGLKWTDQMKRFLLEMARHQWQTNYKLSFDLSKADLTDISTLKVKAPIVLSSTEGKLSVDDVTLILKAMGFFESNKNQEGRGFPHMFETRELAGVKVVVDHLTGLIWQQSGSTESMTHTKAQQQVCDLNSKKFGGYSGWRLPTLEEAMSLMEPTRNNGGLYIDPVFDITQQWIWTADKESAGTAWSISFYHGDCKYSSVNNDYSVRAVRSGQSTL